MTFLVFGGAGGVGSALVNLLLARGDAVFATVRDKGERAAVTKAHGDRVPTATVDLSALDTLHDQLNQALDLAGEVDGVAVCAAYAPTGPLETSSLAEIRRTIDINLTASIAIYQAALPRLRTTGGRLVFVSSMSGRVAMPFVGAYAASKFGLEGAGDVMRREAGPQGVHVALVEPGGIVTPMVTRQLADNEAAIARLSPQEDARYGKLYRGFQATASTSPMSPPEAVAAALVAALTDAEPQTRYIVGADAEQMIGAAAAMSDRDLDTMFNQFFGIA